MRRKREIVCFETGERFASVTDAASAIGAARPLVSSALKRHGKREFRKRISNRQQKGMERQKAFIFTMPTNQSRMIYFPVKE